MDSNANKKILDQRNIRDLVSGYCHRNQKLLDSFSSSIPDAIIEIIVRFYRISAIVNIAIGQCGNQMLMEYLKSLAVEYTIDTKTGKSVSNNSFSGNTYLRYDSFTKTSCARSLCVDLDPGIESILKSKEAYPLLDLNNLCMGTSGANNNWAKGHYTEGWELIDDCLDILRKEIEGHDEPQAIQFMHSLGGGTVMPSPKVSDTVVEPYSAVLSIHQMQEHCDGVFVIDNEALYRLATKQFAIQQPTYQNLNFIANQMVNDVTSLFRYDDSIGFNVSSFLNEMIITPNLKYFTFSRAPFYDESGALLKGQSNGNDLSVLAKSLLDVKRSYTDITEHGIPLSTLVAYRGFDIVDHGKIVKTVQDQIIFSDKDVMTTSICCDGAYGIDCGFMISNNTSIKSVFSRVSGHFGKLFWKQRAFLHHYEAEGMDEREFGDADRCVRDLITSYQDIQDGVIVKDDVEDEDEDEDSEGCDEEEEEESDYEESF